MGRHSLLQGVFPTQGPSRVSCAGRRTLYHCATWGALWRDPEPGVFGSVGFLGESVHLSHESLAVVCRFLYPNRPGNATALGTAYPAMLTPLATKSTGAVLAGTSSNNQRIALSRENTRCTILLHEVSRVHKSRQTVSRLVVARDWDRGIRSEERGWGA